MLKFDVENHKFDEVSRSELKTENILERYDLQETIVNSWEHFKNEIGLPSSFLIGQEIKPHESTQDSIDLLAYDPDDSSLIVIELKRDKNKLQLLQALSYAAMVSKWDTEMLIMEIQKDINPEPDELIDLIAGSDLNSDIKVFLIAESYDPEVILTADWLSSNYSVDITAFAVSVHKVGDSMFLGMDQRYPLKELSDAYEVRSQRKRRRKKRQDIQWDDVLPKLNYSFAKKGIEICERHRAGDPSRRRFGSIRTNYDGFKWISINFRQKYLNVYLKGDFEDAQEFLQSKFRENIDIKPWRDGLSFWVETENQFDDLVKWLNLE